MIRFTQAKEKKNHKISLVLTILILIQLVPFLTWSQICTTKFVNDIIVPGCEQPYTQEWRLQNTTSNCNASGYYLVPHHAEKQNNNSSACVIEGCWDLVTGINFEFVGTNDPAKSNPFSINAGQFVNHRIEFTTDPTAHGYDHYRVFFEIYTSNGTPVSPPLANGRLYAEFEIRDFPTVEPNNTIGTANTTAFSTILWNSSVSDVTAGYIPVEDDEDYYRVRMSDPGILSLTLSSLPANYNMRLYNSSGSLVGSSTNSGTSNEQITYTYSSTATESYYIRVYGSGNANNSCNSYRLDLDWTPCNVSAPSTSDRTICSGETATLSTSSSGTIRWYSSSSSSTVLRTGSTYTTPTLTSSRSYYVSREVNGCESSRTKVDVTVNSTSGPSASDRSICSGETASLSTSSSGTIRWYSSSSSSTVLRTGSTYTTPVLTSSRSYYVSREVNGCESNRTRVDVTVNSTSSPSALDRSICSGETATLSTSSSGTIRWYSSSSSSTVLHTGSTYTTPTLTNSRSYYVSRELNNCESNRTKVDVTVNSIPSGPNASDRTICSGETASLSTSSSGTIRWYSSNSSSTVLGTGSSYTTPVLTSTQDYYVSREISGCESSRTRVDVIVNSIPSSPSASDRSICSGETATLSTSSSGTIRWYSSSSSSTVLRTSSTYTTPTLTSSRSYYVSREVNNCESNRRRVDVTVSPFPNNNLAVTASDPDIAFGASTTINIANSQTGMNYQLRNDANDNNIGTAVTGTGGTINLSTGALSTTTTFNVLVVNASNSSCFQELNQTVTVMVEIPLSTPNLLTPQDGENVNGSPVSFGWGPVNNALQYTIQIATSDAAWDPLQGFDVSHLIDQNTGSQLTYDWLGMQPGQIYYWTVRAENGTSIGEYASPIGFIYASALPFVNLSYPHGDFFQVGQTIPIEWTAANQAQYEIKLYKGGLTQNHEVGLIATQSSTTIRKFDWVVPTTITNSSGASHTIDGTDYRIGVLISNANGDQMPDFSSGDVSITIGPPPFIVRTNANTYNFGDAITVNWFHTPTATNNLRIYLRRDVNPNNTPGPDYHLFAQSADASLGTATFTIPNTLNPAGDWRIVLEDQNNSNTSALSTPVVINDPSLTNHSPIISNLQITRNGFFLNGSFTITDSDGDQVKNLRVYFRKQGDSWSNLYTVDIGDYNQLQATGAKNFQINIFLPPFLFLLNPFGNGNYELKVEAADERDLQAATALQTFSYGLFSFTSPAPGSIWNAGDDLNINFETEVEDQVRLTLHRNGQQVYDIGTFNVSASGAAASVRASASGTNGFVASTFQHLFPIPSTAVNGNDYQVVVEDVNTGEIASSDPFSITGGVAPANLPPEITNMSVCQEGTELTVNFTVDDPEDDMIKTLTIFFGRTGSNYGKLSFPEESGFFDLIAEQGGNSQQEGQKTFTLHLPGNKNGLNQVFNRSGSYEFKVLALDINDNKAAVGVHGRTNANNYVFNWKSPVWNVPYLTQTYYRNWSTACVPTSTAMVLNYLCNFEFQQENGEWLTSPVPGGYKTNGQRLYNKGIVGGNSGTFDLDNYLKNYPKNGLSQYHNDALTDKWGPLKQEKQNGASVNGTPSVLSKTSGGSTFGNVREAGAFLERYNIESQYFSGITKNTLINNLERGPFILSTRLYGSGHILVVVGYDALEDKFIVNDPWGDANVSNSPNGTGVGHYTRYTINQMGTRWGLLVPVAENRNNSFSPYSLFCESDLEYNYNARGIFDPSYDGDGIHDFYKGFQYFYSDINDWEYVASASANVGGFLTTKTKASATTAAVWSMQALRPGVYNVKTSFYADPASNSTKAPFEVLVDGNLVSSVTIDQTNGGTAGRTEVNIIPVWLWGGQTLQVKVSNQVPDELNKDINVDMVKAVYQPFSNFTDFMAQTMGSTLPGAVIYRGNGQNEWAEFGKSDELGVFTFKHNTPLVLGEKLKLEAAGYEPIEINLTDELMNNKSWRIPMLKTAIPSNRIKYPSIELINSQTIVHTQSNIPLKITADNLQHFELNGTVYSPNDSVVNYLLPKQGMNNIAVNFCGGS